MKKDYIQPAMCLAKIQHSGIICLSEVESNIDGLNGYDKNGGDQGSAWVKRGGEYNVWNDDWSQ